METPAQKRTRFLNIFILTWFYRSRQHLFPRKRHVFGGIRTQTLQIVPASPWERPNISEMQKDVKNHQISRFFTNVDPRWSQNTSYGKRIRLRKMLKGASGLRRTYRGATDMQEPQGLEAGAYPAQCAIDLMDLCPQPQGKAPKYILYQLLS